MVCNNVVKFLVNREQLDRIKTRASEQGYVTLSDYLRDVAFNGQSTIDKFDLRLLRVELMLERIEEKIEKH